MPVALEADRQGTTSPTLRASAIDAWMNSVREFTVSSAVPALAAREGWFGGNLLWGSWTLGAWAAPALAAVRCVRNVDNQQVVAHSEAVGLQDASALPRPIEQKSRRSGGAASSPPSGKRTANRK